jgi:F420-dependent oxidoreductase-like protein
MAAAGQSTSRIELGTEVLQTFPCHPLLQAQRAASVSDAMGLDRFTLGIGPSHRPLIEGMLGLSYDHPGRNTEEYVRTLAAPFRGEEIDFEGRDWTAHLPAGTVMSRHRIPVLLSALGSRLLRVAGEMADGTIIWMAPAKAIETHIAPKIEAASRGVGRPHPRIVAGLPVAVHDDEVEARSAAAVRRFCMPACRTISGS